MTLLNARSRTRRRVPVLCLLATAIAAPLHAAEFRLADGEVTGTWTTRATYGMGMRTTGRSEHLVGKGFRSDGVAKGGDGADTADDGNLNYGAGDVYSSLFKLSTAVDLKWRNLGVAVSGRAWYDTALKDNDVPQGNQPSGFKGNAPLSDHDFSQSNQFSGAMLLDAYVYGRFKLGESTTWDSRLGKQRVKWGEGVFFQGVNQVNPYDYTTLRRPGTDPATEAQLPVELWWNKLSFDNGVSVEAFYQWRWRPTELDPCGTFWSGADIGIDNGCSGLQSNAYYPINAYSPGAGQWLSDGYMNAVGAYLPRGRDIEGKDSGQYGVAAHYTIKPIATDLGLYWMRYNSRLPILNATTPNMANADPTLVARMTADGVPLAYAQLSQRLSTITESWEYPEDLTLMGLSASHKAGAWKFAGEVSFTQDLPVQINTADMFAALTRNGGPVGGRTAGQDPGFLLKGYDRFDKWQAQASVARTLGPVLGAGSGVIVGEAAWQHVDLPGLDVARYGRGFAWGYSPQGFDGSCGAVQNPQGCVNKGYFTKMAWGYRVRGQLNYAVGSTTLSPSLTWGQDVHGYAVDATLVQDRKTVSLGLAAKFAGNAFASVAYTNYLGDNPYDVLADHDNVVMAIGTTF
ncbi:DUF1302 domain-containing protein [Pseudoxanthomonas winnipegensis]|uniref:DUF1302 domain-containing protein n=1 Tax=Pseudoxanthomonas winnipegensis TaxID=2480810 RepID=UPI0030F46270